MARNQPKIQTFYPPMEVFKSVTKTIEYVEKRGGHLAGICKVVPPKEWVPRSTPYSEIDDMIIPQPTLQVVVGQSGTFQFFPTIQKAMTVADFREMANSPRHMAPSEDVSECETYYWRRLNSIRPVYGADLQGTVSDIDLKVWNLANMGTILDEVSETKIPGVNTPYLYFGMFGASFPWHTEDMDLYSMNYIHYGASKLWYAIPPSCGRRFEELANALYNEMHRLCKGYLRHKACMISPKTLRMHNIPFDRVEQKCGEIVITFPYGYHAGFNLGYNCAESTNMASLRWIEYGKRCQPCMCQPDNVKINMEVFVKKYQPHLYEQWLKGEDVDKHPEHGKKVRAGPLSLRFEPRHHFKSEPAPIKENSRKRKADVKVSVGKKKKPNTGEVKSSKKKPGLDDLSPKRKLALPLLGKPNVNTTVDRSKLPNKKSVNKPNQVCVRKSSKTALASPKTLNSSAAKKQCEFKKRRQYDSCKEDKFSIVKRDTDGDHDDEPRPKVGGNVSRVSSSKTTRGTCTLERGDRRSSSTSPRKRSDPNNRQTPSPKLMVTEIGLMSTTEAKNSAEHSNASMKVRSPAIESHMDSKSSLNEAIAMPKLKAVRDVLPREASSKSPPETKPPVLVKNDVAKQTTSGTWTHSPLHSKDVILHAITKCITEKGVNIRQVLECLSSYQLTTSASFANSMISYLQSKGSHMPAADLAALLQSERNRTSQQRASINGSQMKVANSNSQPKLANNTSLSRNVAINSYQIDTAKRNSSDLKASNTSSFPLNVADDGSEVNVSNGYSPKKNLNCHLSVHPRSIQSPAATPIPTVRKPSKDFDECFKSFVRQDPRVSNVPCMANASATKDVGPFNAGHPAALRKTFGTIPPSPSRFAGSVIRNGLSASYLSNANKLMSHGLATKSTLSNSGIVRSRTTLAHDLPTPNGSINRSLSAPIRSRKSSLDASDCHYQQKSGGKVKGTLVEQKRAHSLSGAGWNTTLPNVWSFANPIPSKEVVLNFNQTISHVAPHCSVCWVVSNEDRECTKRLRSQEEDVLPEADAPRLSQLPFAGSATHTPEVLAKPVGLLDEGVSPLLTCSQCNVCVHASCYGVELPVDADSWACDVCVRDWTKPAICCLCPALGGELKRTLDERWVHITCALLLPTVSFSDYVHRTNVVVKDDDLTEAVDKACTACFIQRGPSRGKRSSRPRWPCINCTQCKRPYHMPCAIYSGVSVTPQVSADEARCELSIDCCRLRSVVNCAETCTNGRRTCGKADYVLEVDIGERVIAMRPNGQYQYCQLLGKHKRLFYKVMFDDGSRSEDMPPADVLSIDGVSGKSGHPALHSRVRVRWSANETLMASFQGSHTPDTYTVKFADGIVDDVICIYKDGESLPTDIRQNLAKNMSEEDTPPTLEKIV